MREQSTPTLKECAKLVDHRTVRTTLIALSLGVASLGITSCAGPEFTPVSLDGAPTGGAPSSEDGLSAGGSDELALVVPVENEADKAEAFCIGLNTLLNDPPTEQTELYAFLGDLLDDVPQTLSPDGEIVVHMLGTITEITAPAGDDRDEAARLLAIENVPEINEFVDDFQVSIAGERARNTSTDRVLNWYDDNCDGGSSQGLTGGFVGTHDPADADVQ